MNTAPSPGKPLRDIFLSHRGADKEALRELAGLIEAESFQGRGLVAWLDEAEIHAGQSIPGMVNAGLECSRFFGLMMTPAYFDPGSPPARVLCDFEEIRDIHYADRVVLLKANQVLIARHDVVRTGGDRAFDDLVVGGSSLTTSNCTAGVTVRAASLTVSLAAAISSGEALNFRARTSAISSRMDSETVRLICPARAMRRNWSGLPRPKTSAETRMFVSAVALST
jgi:hypothetical protein